MICKKINKKTLIKGFTLVELIVVITIIGILASITIVSYNGWQRNISITEIKNDLNGAFSAMENARSFNDVYPTSIPASFSSNSRVTLSLYSSDATGFCIDAVSQKDASLHYYINQVDGERNDIKEGSCVSQFLLSFKQISKFNDFACGVASNDQAYCWGYNSFSGQLGNKSYLDSSVPAAVDRTGVLSGKTIKSISTGYYHACAIASDNQVYCWGSNSYGQLGNNSTTLSNIPVAVDKTDLLNGKTVKSISSGGYHSCVVASDDQAYCWGRNSNGRLGNNSIIQSNVPVAVDKTVALNGKTVKSISAGFVHTCAIASDDQAYCWGYNYYGQLGNNSTLESPVPVAVDKSNLLNGKTVKSISSGYSYTCAIASDDQAYCWGLNDTNQLGNNSITESHVPVAVDKTVALNGKTVKSISSGKNHACVIASDNQIYCWGQNTYAQLGNGTLIGSGVPTAITTAGALINKTIKSVQSGRVSSCAIASDDQVYCWGNNYYGQLGKGTSSQGSRLPVAVSTDGVLSGKTIKSISAGGGSSCVIASDDKAYCWGYNSNGQLGNDSYVKSNVPVAVNTAGVLSGKTIKSISASSSTCTIASDNYAYCWGKNNLGQLGDNSIITSPVPVAVYKTGVLSSKTILSLSSGDNNTCVIASDNNAYCWGYNYYGQLGNGLNTDSNVPVTVSTAGVLSGKTIKSISTAGGTVCAIASDNNAYCWGWNGQGQLGNNSTTHSNIPVAVNTTGALSGKTIKSISVGAYSTCAIASDDKAYCWGTNAFGELGNGTTVSMKVPFAVSTDGVLSGKTIKSISNGYNSACAIDSDDKAYCWGRNTYGQLGNNLTTSSKVPVAVTTDDALSGKTLKSISFAIGEEYVCAIASDNKAYCWGMDSGNLGYYVPELDYVPNSVSAPN